MSNVSQSPKKSKRPTQRPASPGDRSSIVTPMDVSPGHASWEDVQIRERACVAGINHEEALLDETIEESFPASDPPGEKPAATSCTPQDSREFLLDEALEETFPASDAIAVSPDRARARGENLAAGQH